MKGLLALLLIITLACVNPIMTEAKEYISSDDLKIGDTVTGGDVFNCSGSITIIIDNSTYSQSGDLYTLSSGSYEVISFTPNGQDLASVTLRTITPSTPTPQPTPVITPQPAAPAASEKTTDTRSAGNHTPIEEESEAAETVSVPAPDPHEHSFSWVTTQAPTESSDGREEYRCSCGIVADSKPISVLVGVTDSVLTDIANAPLNGTVIIDSTYLRCLSSKMIDMLHSRPDVTLTVVFTDKGVTRQFTIPAGAAPTDGAEYYGYYYLGALYGWE